MIDVQLLKYPEQLAARLSKMERELKEATDEIKKLKKKIGG